MSMPSIMEMRVDFDQAMVKECGERALESGVLYKNRACLDVGDRWKRSRSLRLRNEEEAEAEAVAVVAFLSDVESGDKVQ